MGCLRTFASMGAVAMVATSVFIAAPAAAADLGAPPMMAPPPPLPMVDNMGGLYLRGDIGIANYDNAKHTSSFANAAVVVPGFNIDRSNFDNVAFGGVGIGYQFNNWLRADVTGEMRGTNKFSAIESYTNAWNNGGCGARCYDTYNANINTSLFLANAYVDLGTWGGFTPFVGVGVGVANHKLSGLYDLSPQPAGGFGISEDKRRSELAWALMAGVGFDVTRNFKMEVGYRYVDMGSLTSNAIQCQGVAICPREVHKYELDSHDIRVGFRYIFGGDAPPSMPAPALVRKY